MRFVAIFAALAACNSAPEIDPKVEAAVVSLEKFAADAKAGDCVALKTASDAVHADESIKAVVAESPLAARVKAADEKVKPLFDACAAEAAAAAAAPVAPVEGAVAPVAPEAAVAPVAPAAPVEEKK